LLNPVLNTKSFIVDHNRVAPIKGV
jgi:hypothetical protein